MTPSWAANPLDSASKMIAGESGAKSRAAIIIIVVMLVMVRGVAYSCAGGLWRDEAHSVNLATSSSKNLFHILTNNESFPVAWQLSLRGWVRLFGSNDASVRTLGLLIGMAVIPSLWWMTRQFGFSFPWWSMLLLGLDPTLIIFGGEVRGYGLGVLTLLLLIGASWNALNQPRLWRWFCLTIAALCAVQSSYTNCVLLAATFFSCCLVALMRRRYRTCIGFAVIGILVATTMLPYSLYVIPRMTMVVKPVYAPSSFWTRMLVFRKSLGLGGPTRAVIWCILGLVGALELYRRVCFRTNDPGPRSKSEWDVAVFTMAFFWAGTCGFWCYMNYLDVITQTWYYLPYLTLLAVTTDFSFQLGLRPGSQHGSSSKQSPDQQNDVTTASPFLFEQCDRARTSFRISSVSKIAAVCVCLLICADLRGTLPYRLTSTDQVARELSVRASEKDLVVVMPWYLGISFDRYYHGPAEWLTLPDVDHDRQHNGYDELFRRVMPLPPPEAIRVELDKIERVLRSGNTVWWVGPNPELASAAERLQLTGAPDPRHGWAESAYMKAWQQQAVDRMHAVGVSVSELPIQRPRIVNANENPSVYSFSPKRSEAQMTSHP